MQVINSIYLFLFATNAIMIARIAARQIIPPKIIIIPENTNIINPFSFFNIIT